MPLQRLQKVIAAAGLASRRGAEALIAQGRVAVNGTVTTEPGVRVDPARDEVRVDGVRLPGGGAASPPRLWWAAYKPKGMVTTLSDPRGRPTVRDLLPPRAPRVFPVGRLDWDAEGLLLFTNDGALAHALLHPARGVERRYRVKVKGRPGEESRARLRDGVPLGDGPARFQGVREISAAGGKTWLEVIVTEGRNHLVKRMFLAEGFPVVKLKRVGFGPIDLGSLSPRQVRPLSGREVRALEQAGGGRGKRPPSARPVRRAARGSGPPRGGPGSPRGSGSSG